MAWTQWRKLANKDEWFDDQFDYTGASVYELGTGGARGGNIQIHYVGETKSEKSRMRCYAAHGSHLSEIIDDHLKRGWCLFYRGMRRGSKEAAVATQNSLLAKHSYDWNIMMNIDDSD